MQFNLVNNKEMLDFLYIRVHDEVVCLVVSSLRHVCRYSCRSQGLSTMAIWNQVGKSVVWSLLFFKRSFSCSAFLLPSQNPFIFFSFSTVITVWRLSESPWVGAHGWVARMLAMGAFYCLGGWSQWRPLDILAPTFPQLDAVVNWS